MIPCKTCAGLENGCLCGKMYDWINAQSSIPSTDLVGCPRCGGKMVAIRGKHPGNPRRVVCPTCLCEQVEFIAGQADRAGNWAVECAKSVVPSNAGGDAHGNR